MGMVVVAVLGLFYCCRSFIVNYLLGCSSGFDDYMVLTALVLDSVNGDGSFKGDN